MKEKLKNLRTILLGLTLISITMYALYVFWYIMRP